MSKPLISIATAAILATAATPVVAQSDAAAAPPTRAEIKSNLDARFKAIDTNGDGAIGKAEIDAANALVAKEAAAAVSKRVEAEFAQLDSDKNGQISLTEFRAAAPDPRPTPADETLAKLDSNKDGKISLQEFGGDTLGAFDRLDANKDGKLTQQEQQAAARR